MTMDIHGFAFPFRIDRDTGRVAAESGDDKLRANIAHILMTGVGERIMRRGYGGGLRQLVHDPNNNALWAIVQHQVAKAIGLLEPRVQVQELTLSQSDDGATLFVTVRYIIRNTKQVQNLSVPVGLGGL
jgi:phage baseplate assembly protein W